MVAAGHRAVMVYLVQRGDTHEFALAREIDPAYAAAFDLAGDAGVEMLAYDCRVSPEEIAVNRRIPVLG
jgi:sugar fermentation stimulation protein A